jgi:hypothetical protein
MKMIQTALLSFLAGLACNVYAPKALAQTVYRCGSTYSQTPCKGAVTLDVNDGRTAAQRHEAQKIIDHDKKAAKALETERLQQEKKIAAQDAAVRKEAEKRKLAAQGTVEPVQPGHQIQKKPKKGPKEPEFFTAATGKKVPEKKSEKP